MTKSMLVRRLLGVFCLIGAILLGAVLGRYFGGTVGQEAYVIARDFKEIIIALGAVYLAHVFQQRAFFVQSLRSLWSDIIRAKNLLVQYTHDPALTAEKFGQAHQQLSYAIDDLRAVYSNVGESRQQLGYFPFEPLHDMRRALDALGFVETDAEGRKLARARIMQAWHALRFNFRREFQPPQATRPVTARYSRDPRRPEEDFWGHFDGRPSG